MTLKRPDRLSVVTLAIAALMILFPPWFKRSGEQEFLGLHPLLAPPHYTVIAPNPAAGEGRFSRRALEAAPAPSELGDTASIERSEGYVRTHPKGRIGLGVLATQLLALGIVALAVAFLRRRTSPPL